MLRKLFMYDDGNGGYLRPVRYWTDDNGTVHEIIRGEYHAFPSRYTADDMLDGDKFHWGV